MQYFLNFAYADSFKAVFRQMQHTHHTECDCIKFNISVPALFC